MNDASGHSGHRRRGLYRLALLPGAARGRLSSGRLRQFFDRPPQFRQRHRWCTGDLSDRAALDRVFAQHEIAAVMHFAASSLVGESVADPQKYYVNNVAGTLSLLEAMRARRMPSPGVFVHRRGLRQRRQQGAARNLSLRADQSLRRLEMDDRAHARRLSQRLRVRRVLPALFQRQRRRPRRRHRRTARQRNPSHSPRHDGAAGPRAATSRCSATITTRPTAPRSATTFMSPIWRRRMSRR